MDSKFKTGNTKGAGRPKGSKNRTTEEARAFFCNVLEQNEVEILKAFEKLAKRSPKTYLAMIFKLSDHVLPKMQSIAVDQTVSGEIESILKLDAMDLKQLIEKMEGNKDG